MTDLRIWPTHTPPKHVSVNKSVLTNLGRLISIQKILSCHFETRALFCFALKMEGFGARPFKVRAFGLGVMGKLDKFPFIPLDLMLLHIWEIQNALTPNGMTDCFWSRYGMSRGCVRVQVKYMDFYVFRWKANLRHVFACDINFDNWFSEDV